MLMRKLLLIILSVAVIAQGIYLISLVKRLRQAEQTVKQQRQDVR